MSFLVAKLHFPIYLEICGSVIFPNFHFFIIKGDLPRAVN